MIFTEEEKVEYMCLFFGWDDSLLSRFHALRILRQARGEPYPTWDDFRLGK